MVKGFIESVARLIVKKWVSPAHSEYAVNVEWVGNLIREAIVSEDGRKHLKEYDNEIPGTLYRHKKTDTVYRTIGSAKNCTNAQDGQEMVMYRQEGIDNGMVFCRDKAEFAEKFEYIES